MSLREIGKLRRRRRILDAARDRIEAGGAEGFSIKSVAGAAQVSVATLYNLFGSKEGVLIGLLMESIAQFEKELEELDVARPIDRIEAIAQLAIEEFTSEEHFYRTLLGLIERMDSRAQLLGVIRRCVDLGHESIRSAVRTGEIQPVVDPRVLAHQIFMGFVHALRMWSSGLSSSDLFEAQVVHFRTLMLAGVANEPLRSELHDRLRALDASMLELVEFGSRLSDPERQAGVRMTHTSKSTTSSKGATP